MAKKPVKKEVVSEPAGDNNYYFTFVDMSKANEKTAVQVPKGEHRDEETIASDSLRKNIVTRAYNNTAEDREKRIEQIETNPHFAEMLKEEKKTRKSSSNEERDK